MTKAGPSYGVWLGRRIEAANKMRGENRRIEYARVRASIADFKRRNIDDLGPVFFDGMLTELDKAEGAKKPPAPKPSPPSDAGAFD